jgi:hypothetical protein
MSKPEPRAPFKDVRWIILALALGGCGGSKAAGAQQAGAPAGGEASGDTLENALQLCHVTRTDYAYIAKCPCPDGSVPLGGDPQAAADARVGSQGQGPDGHVIDLYEVPCRPKPKRV